MKQTFLKSLFIGDLELHFLLSLYYYVCSDKQMKAVNIYVILSLMSPGGFLPQFFSYFVKVLWICME